jgi:hypothetical protein
LTSIARLHFLRAIGNQLHYLVFNVQSLCQTVNVGSASVGGEFSAGLP